MLLLQNPQFESKQAVILAILPSSNHISYHQSKRQNFNMFLFVSTYDFLCTSLYSWRSMTLPLSLFYSSLLFSQHVFRLLSLLVLQYMNSFFFSYSRQFPALHHFLSRQQLHRLYQCRLRRCEFFTPFFSFFRKLVLDPDIDKITNTLDFHFSVKTKTF